MHEAGITDTWTQIPPWSSLAIDIGIGIGIDIKGPDIPLARQRTLYGALRGRVRVRDIQRALIARQRNAIRHQHNTIRERNKRLGTGIEKIDCIWELRGLHAGIARVPAVGGVGEPEVRARVGDEVVGAVEVAAAEVVEDGGGGAGEGVKGVDAAGGGAVGG